MPNIGSGSEAIKFQAFVTGSKISADDKEVLIE